jgi:hypothetical protein
MIEERNRPVNQTTSTSSSTLPNRIVFHSDCFSTNRKNNAFYTKKEIKKVEERDFSSEKGGEGNEGKAYH